MKLFNFRKVIIGPDGEMLIDLGNISLRKYLKIKLDYIKPRGRKLDVRVVAGMATMPSRIRSFNIAFVSLIRLVDHLYLYLDGHDDVPEIAKNHSKVTPIFSKDVPGLRANGKLIGLTMEKEDCLYFCADDDMYYTRGLIRRMRRVLSKYNDKAVVGLLGLNQGNPPEGGGILVATYAGYLRKTTRVDKLGTGSVLFRKSELQIDVLTWPKVSMTDLGVAIQAAKRGLPMLSIARFRRLLIPIEERQTDSLAVARSKNPELQKELKRELFTILSDLKSTE